MIVQQTKKRFQHTIFSQINQRKSNWFSNLTAKFKNSNRNNYKSEFKYTQFGIGLACCFFAFKSLEDGKTGLASEHLPLFVRLAENVYGLQYAANHTNEDRILFGKLKSVEGDVAAVFDGHGGSFVGKLTSRICLETINRCNRRSVEPIQR